MQHVRILFNQFIAWLDRSSPPIPCGAPGFEIKVVVRLKPGNSIHRRGEATNHGSTGMNGFHLGGGKAGIEDDVILLNIFFKRL
jgi:hypothetical protein